MREKLQNLLKALTGKKSKGQSLVEYGLILALVSVIAIGVLSTMGTQIRNTVSTINTQLQQAQNLSNTNSNP